MENQQISIYPQTSTLPGVGNLLKRTWQAYKSRLGTFLGIMILPVIFRFLFLIPEVVLKVNLALGIFLLVVFGLASIIIGFWSDVSLIFAIKEREQKIGIKEFFQKGWHKIIPFIWISILTGFITTGGFMLLIIPGIIFSVWFAFSNFILISEDLKGTNALFRSRQWVSGNWWRVFWRHFVISIIAIIVYLGISFPFRVFLGEIGGDIASTIILLFLIPFSTLYSFLIYEDFKKLKGEIAFEPPKRGTKIKYILVGVLGFLLIPGIILVSTIVLTSLSGAKSKARDARREMDMRQFSTAQEMYYMDNGKYYISGEQDGTPAIPPYLVTLDDPQAPNKHYKWLDNTSCDQHYCVYAILENKRDCNKTAYFAASEKGTKIICEKAPTDGCKCFGVPKEIE